MVTDIDLDEIIQEIEGSRDPGHASPVGLLRNPFLFTGIGGVGNQLIPPLEPAVSLQVREFLRAALSSTLANSGGIAQEVGQVLDQSPGDLLSVVVCE